MPLLEGGFCKQCAAVPHCGGALRGPLVDLRPLTQWLRPRRHNLRAGHAGHTAAGAQRRLSVSQKQGGNDEVLSLIPPANLLEHQTCQKDFHECFWLASKAHTLSMLLRMLASPTTQLQLLLANFENPRHIVQPAS